MQIKIDLSEVRRDFNKSVKILQEVAQKKVVIKFDEQKTYENGMKVETVAFFMEYGSDDLNVHYPARPFWRNTMIKYENKMKKRFENRLQAVLDGKMTVDAMYKDLGKQYKRYIKATIKEGNFAPLSESSLKLRKIKGTGTQPLIDTKLLINSIIYEVV